MDTSWFIRNLIVAFVLPPFSLLWLLLLAWLGRQRFPRLAKVGFWVGLFLLYLTATPWCANRLAAGLERGMAWQPHPDAQAIVVLGGGRQAAQADFHESRTLSKASLQRARYAAWLHRKTGLPILVSGGAPDGGIAEAVLQQRVLQDELGVRVQWLEGASNTTAENASFSARLLRQHGVGRVYVVSDAWHLRRALPQFQQQGLQVYPAGVAFHEDAPFWVRDWLPHAGSWRESGQMLHEWLGIVWYALRH
ncbi:YdcF family protein [Leeia aquatica]|uniref:YdcF family protein n=1 Tax=Leeia aquatica TaxID=2725557 RepID=A0A847S8N5_9NEIS|nr:YdcF family protein [Leeia aquatica]NLR76123.1 YdcF family protein [Leeia aquatica]